MLMKRKRAAENRAPISPGLLPILSMKKYTLIFIGISMSAKTNCVRYRLSPNPEILRLIP